MVRTESQPFRLGSDVDVSEESAPAVSGIVGLATPRGNRRNRVLRTRSARIALEPFIEGTDYEVLTNGEFSLLDAILVLLERSGPAHVSISTYSAGIYDAEVVNRFIETGNILSIRFILDVAFKTLGGSKGYAVTLMDVFGEAAIRTTRNHAKFVTITNDTHAYSISSTGNLNENKRLELFYFSDNQERSRWFDSIFDELFENVRPGWNPDTGAPGLNRLDQSKSIVASSGSRITMGRIG